MPLTWGSAGTLGAWGTSPADHASGVRAVCRSQSMRTNAIEIRAELEPGPCPLPLPSVPAPALGSHCKAEAPPHVLSGSGLDSTSWAWFQQRQISRGPSSSGTPTRLPKTESQHRPSKTRPQLGWGWRGAGEGSSHSPPQGAQGCPLEPKRPGLGAKRAPDRQARRQPQSIKIEVMLLKLKKPPAQKRRRRRWQCDRVTGSS